MNPRAVAFTPIERRERFMGLGSLDHISLAEARKARDEARETIRRGADPIEERGRVREQTQIEERLQAARSMSFDDCAATYFSSHKAAWKNPKHRQQFVNTLATYVSPVFGSLPVSSIDTALVCAALEKDNLWTAKPETASRVRGRIENILAWAAVRGYRTNPNPAQWKNHLDHLLPPQSKVHRVKHHSALPYQELPTFMTTLAERTATAAAALRFAILTAARTNEVIGAKWNEIDFESQIWTVPAERMKASREHRVPLSAGGLAIIESMRASRMNDFIFPGERAKKLSNMAMLMLIRRMKINVTVHGFRSSFRDWVGNKTAHPRDVMTLCANHHRQMHYGGIDVVVSATTFDFVIEGTQVKVAKIDVAASIVAS